LDTVILSDELAEALEKAANEAMMADEVAWAMLMHRAAGEILRLRAALGPRGVSQELTRGKPTPREVPP
jgi:hypothetical protein